MAGGIGGGGGQGYSPRYLDFDRSVNTILTRRRIMPTTLQLHRIFRPSALHIKEVRRS